MSPPTKQTRRSGATAQASPNLAFIKYWGNRDDALRLPANGSISMNLDGLTTRTTVSFQTSLPYDELILNGREVAGTALERVSLPSKEAAMTDETTVSLDLNRNEFELVKEALRLLLSTLGREEAEELEEVRALLGRLVSQPTA